MQDIVDTLLKMYLQLHYACDSCACSEVCEEAAEIHRRLQKERER